MPEEDPRLDPAEIRGARFPGNSRKYEAKAVDRFLAATADRVAATNALVDDLKHRVREAERAVAHAETQRRDVDLSTISEEELVALIGEETTSVLATARRAAEEIRGKAEESAARMIREATAEAKEERDRAWAEVGELRTEAKEARDQAVETAERETANIRREAQSEAERVIAEAHAAAAAHLEDVESQRDQIKDEAAKILVEARDEGRAMVSEAKEVRAWVLDDLQRRREAGRGQIDELLDGRDRLLGALENVGSEVTEVMASLRAALPDTAFAAVDDAVGTEVVPDAEDLVGLDDVDEHADETEVADEAEVAGEPEPSSDIDDTPSPGVAVAVDHDSDPDDDTRAPVEPAATDEPASDREAGASEDVDSALSTDAAPVDDVAAERASTEDEVDASATEEPVTSDVDQIPADFLAPAALLEARAAALDEFGGALAKALKRHLADEQNDVLDLLRRTERADLAEMFSDEETHVAAYARVAHPMLTAVASAGTEVVADGSRVTIDVSDLTWTLGAQLVEPFRRKVERAIEEVSGDFEAVDERLRALYREWKASQIESAASDALLSAFALGTFEAVPAGADLLWCIDPEQGPCSDAQDNALAGATPKGDEFPTGDICPQAHPGCRCVLSCVRDERTPR